MAATDTIGVAFLGVRRRSETHLRNVTTLNRVRVVRLIQERGAAVRIVLMRPSDRGYAWATARIEAGDSGGLETFRVLSPAGSSLTNSISV